MKWRRLPSIRPILRPRRKGPNSGRKPFSRWGALVTFQTCRLMNRRRRWGQAPGLPFRPFLLLTFKKITWVLKVTIFRGRPFRWRELPNRHPLTHRRLLTPFLIFIVVRVMTVPRKMVKPLTMKLLLPRRSKFLFTLLLELTRRFFLIRRTAVPELPVKFLTLKVGLMRVLRFILLNTFWSIMVFLVTSQIVFLNPVTKRFIKRTSLTATKFPKKLTLILLKELILRRRSLFLFIRMRLVVLSSI